MKCLYCDAKIYKESLYSLFIEKDKLCSACREKIKQNHQIFIRDGIKIETFYHYDSLFKDLLLQYKECYDEALKDVFLYGIKERIILKYHGYKIIYVPSSKEKLNQRGFNHLKLIFDELHFEEVSGLRMIEELSQVNKDKKQRENMLNNDLYEGNKLDKVLIVDDVYTTGSSIIGVSRALKPYANNIRALTLAKVS